MPKGCLTSGYTETLVLSAVTPYVLVSTVFLVSVATAVTRKRSALQKAFADGAPHSFDPCYERRYELIT